MNVNVTKIQRLPNGIIQFYNGTDIIDSFSITSSVSVLFENNSARNISFVSNVKTLSFNVFNITSVIGSTSNKTYTSGIDPSDTSDAYISRLYDIYAFLISDVIQGCCPGPTFVGGVVAAYPDYFSFPAVGTPSVIYIDESTGIAYYWDAGAYHELVSGTAPTPLGYYGAWQDNLTQTAAVDNTGYAMIFRTIDLANGIAVVTNGTDLTRITFAHTGVYNLQFSSQFQNIDNQEHDVTIWLRLNGVDVPESSGFIGVPAKHGSVNGHCVVSWNYLLDVVGGQYYELVWSTTSAANVTMQFYAAGSPPPSAASVILTVTQQAGIMAGTGITAINSLTGAVQTLATGTTGTDFAISSTGTTHTFDLPTASATNRGALSSTDWTTFNGKQAALGYTPVPETRTLTINGTSYDLSADRSWTISASASLAVGTTPITSGAVGRVLFEGTGNVLQESGSLFWDNTNSRLGIGTATPTHRVNVLGATGAGRDVIKFKSEFSYTGYLATTNSFVGLSTQANSGGSSILLSDANVNVVGASGIQFTTGGSERARFAITTGNFLIGTGTDAGFKLDVNGTARVSGNATFGASATINSGSLAVRQLIINEAGNVHTFTAPATNRTIRFITNSQSFSLAPTGNVLIGTTTDAGYKLDVNGTARVSSSFRCDGQVTFTSAIIATAQVRIGSNPVAASSVLDVQSTTKGFLPPRMTTTQKNAIASPASGLVVYDTDLGKLCVRGASAWETITSV
jgi:hypothetical protein